MSDVIARLSGARKAYPLGRSTVLALRGLDLELRRAEMVALMGPSGSGKTTLLNVLGCLDTLTEGTYELNGKRIAARDFDALAELRSQELGFIFQSFNLVPVLSVAENVELSMICSGRFRAAERRARVRALLEAVGLDSFAARRPDELSGGQRQRVAIARALAPRPALVLADEPTASLDTETATGILELLLRMNVETGTTLLLATHDPRILPYTRRRLLLRDGLIAEDIRTPAPVPAEDATAG